MKTFPRSTELWPAWRHSCQASGLIVGLALGIFAVAAYGDSTHPSATAAPASVAPSRATTQPATAFEPTDAYELRSINGWPVRLNKRFASEQPELCQRTLRVLDQQLFQITRVVPAKALKKIQSVVIWVDADEPVTPCMCFHVDRGWVVAHGLNPDKVGCVELGNARHFVAWSLQQPWMVLHELAHAYHRKFLPDGFDNADVRAAYDAALKSKRYEHVLHISGNVEKAYATTSVQEFFAEQSEAFFGTNDFYPFVRSELKTCDPQTYEMLRKAWGVGKSFGP